MAEPFFIMPINPQVVSATVAAGIEEMSKNALPDALAAIREMRPEVAKRVTGTFIYPDGKTPCPGGPNGDNIGAAKAHELDPAHCLMNGGPWVRPLLERDIKCEDAGTDLVWGDLIERSQTLLRRLAVAKPANDATWQTKFDYFEAVMTLSNIVLQGMNTFNTKMCASSNYIMPHKVSSIFNPGEQRLARLWRNFGDPSIHKGWGGDDPLPLFVRPRVGPTFYTVNEGLGWAPWICAESRMSKVVRGDISAFAGGMFGANAGQGGPLRNVGICRRRDWGLGACEWHLLGKWDVYRFALPKTVLADINGNATAALVDAFSRTDPRDITRLFFEHTCDRGGAVKVVNAWSFDRIHRVIYQGMPEPARTIDNAAEVVVPNAEWWLIRAREWAQYVGNINVPATLEAAALAYLQTARDVVARLQEKGLRTDVTPADIQEMISAVEAAKTAERAAVVGAMSSVFQILGGVVGAIMQAVSTVVLLGFLEFVNSSKPPSSHEDFNLLLAPFGIRSPSSDTICSFNPGAEGGAERIAQSFTPHLVGNFSGFLWDIAQGKNPPAAPDTLREMVNDSGDDSAGSLMPYLALGGLVVGGALLVRKL